MEQNKEEINGIRMQAPLCDRQIVTELSSDFTLPDYQPEIKRLLRVRATVSPADKYVGAAGAEFSGTVRYAILYAGNDASLYCTEVSEEYQFSAPMEAVSEFEMSDGVICDVETVPDSVVSRVAAARRLSVKCRLRSRVRILGTRLIGEAVHGGGAAVERLYGTAECAREFFGTGETLRLGDEILCDTASQDLRVICAEGAVFVSEAGAGSGVVNCRGELCLKLLCVRDGTEELPAVQLRRIPFSQSVPTDGAEINCSCFATGNCTELDVTVEDGRILCEAAVCLRTCARRNETVGYTRDVFSTEAEGEVQYADLTVPKVLGAGNGNFSLNTTLSLEEAGIRPDFSVVDLSLTPYAVSPEQERGKLVLSGKCRAQAILSGNGDVTVQEFDLPFRYETDGFSEPVTDWSAVITPVTCRARVDGERINVDAEMAVSFRAAGAGQIRALSDAHFGDAVPRERAAFTVCYPSAEDTLWSVAKRYHKSVHALASVNHLPEAPAADSPDSLAGVTYLLI